MSSKAHRIAPLVLLAAVVLIPTFAVAEEGNVCDVPTIDFAWPDSVNPNLIVELKKPGVFMFRIIGRDSKGKEDSVWVRKRHLHPGRNLIRVDLTGFDFYLSNTVTVRYKGYEIDPPHLQDDVCAERKLGEEQIVVFERQLLKFDLGTVYSRNKDDGFDSSPEIAVTATSRWMPWITGGVDIRISELAKLDDSEETEMEPEDPAADPMPGDPAAPAAAEEKKEDVFNPFTESGSIVRGDFYLVFHPWPKNRAKPRQHLYPPSLGLVGGVGFSSFSGDSDSVETKQRVFYGVRTEVQGYNRKRTPGKFGGTTGFVQLGWARDDLWRFQTLEDHDNEPDTEMIAVDQDERDRYFVEAAIQFPNLGGEKGRLAIRFFADVPQSGKGPSDVRFSLLAAIDLKALGKAIGTGG